MPAGEGEARGDYRLGTDLAAKLIENGTPFDANGGD
jgi:hypothetical protein